MGRNVTVSELSDEELVSMAQELYEDILNIDLFSLSDLRLLDTCIDELHKRGYRIEESSKLTFSKPKSRQRWEGTD